MPKSASSGASHPFCYLPSGFRPCLKSIIESGAQLDGGHSLRVAIAAEALNCGPSEKEAVDLFRFQTDFEEAVTTDNIRYVWEQNYLRYSCETAGVC
jgi:DNA primase large subunit